MTPEEELVLLTEELDRLIEILVVFSPVVQQYLDSFERTTDTSEQEMRFVALVRNAMTASETGDRMEPIPSD